MLVSNWLPNWLTNWLPFSKLDWCEPGMWRWQLKTCWSCWWWETVYSVTFSIQFLTVLKSFSRLDSNSLTFLQLVKAVKTLTGGATWSIIYFDFVCTTNFPSLCEEVLYKSIFMQTWNLHGCEGSAGCFILSWKSGTSFKLAPSSAQWMRTRSHLKRLFTCVFSDIS